MNVDFVNEDRVIEEITKAVELYGPDHIDPGSLTDPPKCKNVYEDGTRCIAAQVLSQLGVADKDLKYVNDSTITDTLDSLDLYNRFAVDAIRLLEDAQQNQDEMAPWGHILQYLPEGP